MTKKHLIIGCGSAALAALEKIRGINSDDEINWTVVGMVNTSIAIDNITKMINVTVDPDWNGNETVNFTATDGTDSTTMGVTIVNCSIASFFVNSYCRNLSLYQQHKFLQ